MNAIETKGLIKQYSTNKAVNGLNLQVPSGSICGFLGKNGAGKTTTIKMLVGLTKPTSGSIFLMGNEKKFGDCNNAHSGYLPDVPNFYGYMTASEYLDFCGKLYNLETTKRKSRIEELLKQVDLFGVKTRIAGFSRGMKQRLGIAQALINEPDIIFMDEPISALDPIGRHEVMEIIRSLRGRVTVFFSTHILSDVENICDYALILEKGRILAADSIENIKKNHASNMAKIRFYSETDGARFLSLSQDFKNFSVDQNNSVEFLLRSDDIRAMGKQIPILLSEAKLTLESYAAYVPTLEDIFLEVTSNA
jgi:ABC-2 type transport system ATP-binding protein